MDSCVGHPKTLKHPGQIVIETNQCCFKLLFLSYCVFFRSKNSNRSEKLCFFRLVFGDLFTVTAFGEVWASSNPNDEMVLEEINALAQRVLQK